jgi:hypothetical protein
VVPPHRERPALQRVRLDGRAVLGAAGQLVDRLAARGVRDVVRRPGAGPRGGQQVVGVDRAVRQHRPVDQDRVPREALLRLPERDHAVRDPRRDLQALRTFRGEQDRDVDRPRRDDTVAVQELVRRAVPLHLLAVQQRAQRDRVGVQVLPQAGLPAVHDLRAAGPEADRDPPRRLPGERRDGRGGRHQVPVVGDHHGGAQADAAGPVRGPGERHPDVGVDGGCVVAPGAAVAELLRADDVVRGLQAGGETDGDVHVPSVPGGCGRIE